MFIFLLFIAFFTAHIQGLASENLSEEKVMYRENANLILNSVYYQSPPSIITEHEWKELQLDRLLILLDRTHTSFGRWGLEKLLYPVAQGDDLVQRKNSILFLIEHEKELNLLQQQLDKIHDVEQSVLAYWSRNDAIDKGAANFYYAFPGVQEYLNKSSLALSGSVVTQMFNAWTGLIVSLCLGGLQTESSRWLMSPGEKDFDWFAGLQAGFKEPFMMHNPALDLFKDTDGSYKYTYKDYMKALMFGTWGDKYKLLTSPSKQLNSNFLDTNIQSKDVGILTKINAFMGASLPAVVYDYNKIMSILSVGGHLLSMNRTLNQLHDRIIDVATCFNAIKSIDNLIQQFPDMASNSYVTTEYTDQINQTLERLAAFHAQKGSYFYSRGYVLKMNKEIKEIKRLLIPLLQSVAFLDAFCSIANLYKESQNQPVKFSFPEFVPSSKPFFDYENAWLPLLPYTQAITNNLCLGQGNNCPGKMIITGPNGGGKSTLLKTQGVAAILSQSWLLVPATRGQQTLFAEIKTGLAPQEDLKRGLSTFMAEKKRMGELFEAMQENNAQHRKTLILIDEPYKGTVDDESAKRIYQFGKDVADFSYVLIALATHVKKPIFLPADTNGIFGNYQVKIEELSLGIFKRLFKLEAGPAMWWFDDAGQRSRFIDWISTKPIVAH